MAGRGKVRSKRDTRAKRPAARRPQRSRSARNGSREVRRGKVARRVGGAGKVLGMTTTRRAAVLAIVVCALALTVSLPLRTYLSQRAEVAVEEQRRAELRSQVAELEARQGRLSDPVQVEADARKRLRYVLPGETPFMVQLPGDSANPATTPPPPQQPQANTWYQRLWSSATR